MLIALCSNDDKLYAKYHRALISLAAKTPYTLSFRKVRKQENLFKLFRARQGRPDLVLMGPQLQDADGVAAAKALRCQPWGFEGTLVFIDLPPENLQQAFDAQAFHCVVQGNPNSRRREILRAAMERTREISLGVAPKEVPQIAEQNPKIEVTERCRGQRRLELSQIDYIQVHGRLLEWHCGKRILTSYGTIDGVCGQLNNYDFIRVHRQVVVQTDRMQSCCRKVLTLNNGTQFKVGRTYESAVRAVLAERKSSRLVGETAALRRAPAPARVASSPDATP